jgi:hypothetical protein
MDVTDGGELESISIFNCVAIRIRNSETFSANFPACV